MKLGNLTIGETGKKVFGNFRLTWKVNQDHIAWTLADPKDLDRGVLRGDLKYVGWNRMRVEPVEGFTISNITEHLNDLKSPLASFGMSPLLAEFQVYVHEWPDYKEALDFVYYELGAKAAAGTYEESFIKP